MKMRGLNQNTYYQCSKDFLEPFKKQFRGDTVTSIVDKKVLCHH